MTKLYYHIGDFWQGKCDPFGPVSGYSGYSCDVSDIRLPTNKQHTWSLGILGGKVYICVLIFLVFRCFIFDSSLGLS